jgi:DNA-binding NtrC family response regulator
MLSCESTPGQGAVFTLLLPLCDAAPEPERSNAPRRFANGLRALIIDDECGVRIAVGHLLLEAGLRVRSAPNAAEALALLAAEPEIDVVLLDRCLPDGPGENLVPRIRALAPRARILFFCGYALEPDVADCADGVVYKPATGADLLDAIIRTLEPAAPKT